MVKFKVKVSTPDRLIIDQIYKVVANELNRRLYDVYKPVIRDIREIFKEEIERDPVWESLKNGELQAHLGLYPNDIKPDEILNIWLQSVDAKFQKFQKKGNTYRANLALSLIDEDFTDVLNSPAATYISFAQHNNKHTLNVSNSYIIPWLRWLLIEGDRIVVRNYDINLKLVNSRQVNASRSGKALMFAKPGAGYRLPPQYTGTAKNNFVIDALRRLDKTINDILTDNIEYKI